MLLCCVLCVVCCVVKEQVKVEVRNRTIGPQCQQREQTGLVDGEHTSRGTSVVTGVSLEYLFMLLSLCWCCSCRGSGGRQPPSSECTCAALHESVNCLMCVCQR